MTTKLFRIWDKESGRLLFPNPEIGDWSGGNGNCVNLWMYADGTLNIHGVSASTLIFQQLTGLIDRNGKDIYEGDIVENDRGNRRYEVVWKDYGWFGHSICNDFKYYCSLSSNGAVIGNIIENPELLNEFVPLT